MEPGLITAASRNSFESTPQRLDAVSDAFDSAVPLSGFGVGGVGDVISLRRR